MPAGAEFPALSAEERQSIEAWRMAAANRGLDAVIDLTGRRWNVPLACAIVGIFRIGEARAAWLLIRDDTGWTVLDCVAETIIGGTLTLDDCLAILIP